MSKNSNESPLVNSMFRMVFTNKTVAKSIWKLKIENTSQVEQMFAALAWSIDNLPTAKTPVAE